MEEKSRQGAGFISLKAIYYNNMTTLRLAKFLACSGVASRRAAEELIQQGLVSINGKKCTALYTMVDPVVDTVTYRGKPVSIEHKEYYLLHKPKGYVCTNTGGAKTKRAVDLISTKARLITVGRLDKETSGLIIVTNDGDFANRIMHPSFEIPKEYLVKTDKEVLHDHLVKIADGVIVEGKHVKPLSVKKVRRGTLKVVVLDGRKHEVRLLCEHAGLEVIELVRIRVGHLVLGGLPEGASKPLTVKERGPFFKNDDADKPARRAKVQR